MLIKPSVSLKFGGEDSLGGKYIAERFILIVGNTKKSKPTYEGFPIKINGETNERNKRYNENKKNEFSEHLGNCIMAHRLAQAVHMAATISPLSLNLLSSYFLSSYPGMCLILF